MSDAGQSAARRGGGYVMATVGHGWMEAFIGIIDCLGHRERGGGKEERGGRGRGGEGERGEGEGRRREGERGREGGERERREGGRTFFYVPTYNNTSERG